MFERMKTNEKSRLGKQAFKVLEYVIALVMISFMLYLGYLFFALVHFLEHHGAH